MGNETKKPDQTEAKPIVNWKPEDPKKWKKYDAPPDPKGSRPNVPGWDPNDPEIKHGRVVTFDEDTRVFKVMCCGMTYQINWDDLFAKPAQAETLPNACSPEKDKNKEFLTKVWDVNNYFYLQETKCVLVLNCFITWMEEWTTYRCDNSLKKWKPLSKPRQDEKIYLVTNTFTCCSD